MTMPEGTPGVQKITNRYTASNISTEKMLIDVNEAKRRIIAFATGCHSEVLTVDSIIMMLNQSDTVDAVEVVRCKDCACYEETCPGFGYCYHWDYEQGMSPNQVEQDDFCSYGERRTE